MIGTVNMRKENRFICKFFVALVSLLLNSASAATPKFSYFEAIESESHFDAKTKSAGLLSFAGSDHHIRATEVEAKLYLASIVQDSKIEVVINSQSLRVIDTDLNQKDRAQVQKEMLGERVLDADRYPKIKFTSHRIGGKLPNLVLEGELELHGKKKTLQIPVDFFKTEDGQKVRIQGRFPILQSEFGIQPYSIALETVRVADRLLIEFDVMTKWVHDVL